MNRFGKLPLLFSSLVIAGAIFLAAGPFLDIDKGQHVAESTCDIHDLESRVAKVLPTVEDHMYYLMWRDVLHIKGWDPVPYIAEKLPEEGTCHGMVFAIQRYIYSHPKASAQEAAQKLDLEDIVLFDVMRLTYTELFQYIVAIQQMQATSITPSAHTPEFKEGLRADFQQNINALLQGAHAVDTIEMEVNAGTDQAALAKELTQQLAHFSAPEELMTAQVNVISGPKIAHSMLIKAAVPEFVLFDINAPGGIVKSNAASLETLIEATLAHIQQLYFSHESAGNTGYIQIIIYQAQ